MAVPNPDLPLHLHLAGWSGTSQSIALVNQWQMLALSKRKDVRLSREVTTAPFEADEVFSPQERARLDAIPMMVPDRGIDAELRTPFTASGRRVDHPVLAYVVSELLGNWLSAKMPRPEALRNISRLIYTVPSNWVRNGLIELGIDEKQVALLPHGVETRIFRPSPAARQSVRRQLGLERFTFLNAAALVEVKGHSDLFKATAVLLQRGLPVQLVLKTQSRVYGEVDFSHATDLLTEAERSLLERHIVHISASLSMPSMAALYGACDAYVAPYRAEGFCMPVLEAAACGLPIICTKGGSTDDFTTDDFRWGIRSTRKDYAEHGYGLSPDLDHLIDLMSRMVTARDFHNRAAKAGPRHVAANYTWDVVAGRVVEIVRGIS